MTVHFDDLAPGRCQCRFPLWKGRERTGPVCGEPTRTKSSYCAAHHAVVYEPATLRNIRTVEAAARLAGGSKISSGINPEFEDAK